MTAEDPQIEVIMKILFCLADTPWLALPMHLTCAQIGCSCNEEQEACGCLQSAGWFSWQFPEAAFTGSAKVSFPQDRAPVWAAKLQDALVCAHQMRLQGWKILFQQLCLTDSFWTICPFMVGAPWKASRGLCQQWRAKRKHPGMSRKLAETSSLELFKKRVGVTLSDMVYRGHRHGLMVGRGDLSGLSSLDHTVILWFYDLYQKGWSASWGECSCSLTFKTKTLNEGIIVSERPGGNVCLHTYMRANPLLKLYSIS